MGPGKPMRTPTLVALALALSLPAPVFAAEPAPEGASAITVEPKPVPAWRKEKHMIEVGWLKGAFFPAKDHGLYGLEPPSPARAFKTGFDIGLRLAYLP